MTAMPIRLIPALLLVLGGCAGSATPWWQGEPRLETGESHVADDEESAHVVWSETSLHAGTPWSRVHREIAVGHEFRLGGLVGGGTAVVTSVEEDEIRIRTTNHAQAAIAGCGTAAYRLVARIRQRQTGTSVTGGVEAPEEACVPDEDGLWVVQLFATEVALGMNRVLAQPIRWPKVRDRVR